MILRFSSVINNILLIITSSNGKKHNKKVLLIEKEKGKIHQKYTKSPKTALK